MNVRTAFFRSLFLSVVIGATVAGCSRIGGMRSSLPQGVARVAVTPASAPEDQAALDQAVLRSHRNAVGSADYGVLEGEFVEPPPAPGQPGYYIIDGEVVSGPPDDSPPVSETAPPAAGAASPQATATATPTPNCNTFNGTVPPPCTSTGPFRRVYSAPNYSYALANVTFPKPILTMPTYPPYHGDTAFAYMEGWLSTAPNAGNSEFGFQYSANYHCYYLYARTSNPSGYYIYVLNDKPVRYLSSQTVTFAMAGYLAQNQDELHMSAIGTANVSCGVPGSKKTTNTCLSHGHVPDKGWVESDCCIMARMTSIGQKNLQGYNWFYDGVTFGPIAWSGAELAETAPTPLPSSTTLPFATEPPWTAAGVQNWPPLQNKIVVNYTSGAAETDTINLAALPAEQVSLSPSGCQYYQNMTTATVNYTATASKTKGVPTYYGWGPGDVRMTVPGATLNPVFGLWIGQSNTATWKGGIGGGTSSALFTAFLDILFTDATGELTSQWYYPGDDSGHVVTAEDQISLGSQNLCPSPSPSP
jgi:hypothetical protein